MLTDNKNKKLFNFIVLQDNEIGVINNFSQTTFVLPSSFLCIVIKERRGKW